MLTLSSVVCLCALSLGLTTPLIIDGSPVPSSENSVNDAKAINVGQRESRDTSLLGRVITKRDGYTKSHPLSEKSTFRDFFARVIEKRGFVSPASMLYRRPTEQERSRRISPAAMLYRPSRELGKPGKPRRRRGGFWNECVDVPDLGCYYYYDHNWFCNTWGPFH